jgi:ribonucleoside-triphosphate reductase
MARKVVYRGLLKRCPVCGSKNLVHITRVTGFFSKVEDWNRGKLAELKDRRARDSKYFEEEVH